MVCEEPGSGSSRAADESVCGVDEALVGEFRFSDLGVPNLCPCRKISKVLYLELLKCNQLYSF